MSTTLQLETESTMTTSDQANTQVPDASDASPLVLVIDDCIDVHRLLGARLRSEEMELAFAKDGREGVESAMEKKPALILLDLEMPEMDGFEVLRSLKASPATLDVPVIVLSGLQSPHDKVTAFDLGAIDYITKPFELTELRVRIRSALRLYRLMAMLAQRAQIDGLTGLWNRTYFNERWEAEVKAASRHSRPLSLAMFDIDHFKSINDTYGHPAGDTVIQGLAQLLRTEGRSGDIPCRYGGEEFAMILTDTGPEDAVVICDRIRLALEAKTWSKHPARKITLSCGIAGVTSASDVTPAAWLELADKNLYASKQGGRNRITQTNIGLRAADAA